VAAGDEDEVVAALARDRGRALVGYAYLLTGNVRDAEDLVQDALVKTVLRSRSGVDLDTAEAYVRRAVFTTFIDGHRRLRRWRDAVPRLGHESTLPEPDAADRVTAQLDVRAALASLPRRERACVVLRYYDDLPLADIADALGVSVGAVKRYLSTGTHRLEGLLGPVHGRATDAHDPQGSPL
jgi:RNA polymerase sigma-70 factor (ECF subfamily)